MDVEKLLSGNHSLRGTIGGRDYEFIIVTRNNLCRVYRRSTNKDYEIAMGREEVIPTITGIIQMLDKNEYELEDLDG